MHYYIDGYNLLFKTLRSHENLQQAREALVEDLNDKATATNMAITIVFDAHYQEESLTITHYRNLEIIFSSFEQTADDLIIKLLKSVAHPKSCTLVTSDNKLAWRARQLLVKTEKVETFLMYLNRRYENKIKEKPLKPKDLASPPEIPSVKTQKSGEDYEAIFTSRYKEFEATRKEGKTSKTSAVIRKEKKKPKHYRSDFDRWLDLFQKRANEGENGA